ncbi:MAG: biopolymer transporter ExbD, partial [Gemmatimonadota bacterium]
SSGVTGINVTPLIDVLLVLFLIFLAIVLLGRRTLPVAIPADGGGGSDPQILLDITSSGGYRLNGQPIPGGQLAPVLEAALRSRTVRLVFIRTAPERAYQDFITASDIARGAGASLVAMVSSKGIAYHEDTKE